jgi:hypothetical protein
LDECFVSVAVSRRTVLSRRRVASPAIVDIASSLLG